MRAAASLPSFFSPLPYHLPLIFSVFRGSSKPFPNAASTGNLSLRSNCPIGARDQLAFRDAPRFPARIPRLTARKRAYLLCRWLLSGIEPFVGVPLPSMLEAKADEGTFADLAGGFHDNKTSRRDQMVPAAGFVSSVIIMPTCDASTGQASIG